MPIVQKHGHTVGEQIDSPAYVDANFLKFYTVGSLRLSAYSMQTAARNVMGDLLAQSVTILVSLVTVEEALWATLQEVYYTHISKSLPADSRVSFRSEAKKHWKWLMNYKDDLKKVIGNLQKLKESGADIRFVPEGAESFEVCQNAPELMEKHSLFSADAMHLSAALSQAKTLITFDVTDFARVMDPAEELTIILLPS
jgi:predicted nucleic acid-binding protein